MRDFAYLLDQTIKRRVDSFRTLRAFTAYKDKIDAELSDIKEIAVHTLSHRLRRDPLDESSSEMRVERKINELLNG